MHTRALSRGYSILAALVFVAILGSITAAVNFLSPSANPIAMTSLAGNTSASEKSLATSVEPEVETKCKAAIEAAKKNAGKSPRLEQPFTANTVEQNKCVGAQLDETKLAQVMAAKKIPRHLAAIENEAYTCYGESTKVYMNTAGKGTIVSEVNQGVVKGKCEVTFCDESGSKCAASGSVKDGGSSIRDWAATDKDLLKRMEPEQLEGLQSMGLDQSQQDILKQAYADRQSDMGDQINNNKTRIAEIDRALENCAYGGCNEAQNQPSVKALEVEKAQLEAQNKELAGRLQSLKEAERSVLTPPKDVVPVKDPRLPPPDPRRPGPTFPPPGQGGEQRTGSGAGPGGAGGSGQGGGSSGNPLGMLGGLLQGLMKGLGASANSGGKGAPCSSDPAIFQQQQQQYQMQLQQYNMQLQQYNYQQRQSYDFGGYLQEPPPPPLSCAPNATTNTCPAAPTQPTSGCTNGSWRPVTTQQSNGRQCTTSWQCAPSNAVTPTAELSCQPKVADVGMSIAISFSCGSATGSTGSGHGFSTDDETSGSRSVVIQDPPAGATAMNFAITCRNQNLTARAECSIEIAKPTIVLLANPKNVLSGESARIGWITSGMQACVISSPQMPGFTLQNANNKSVNGIATTTPITRDTTVVLRCTTVGGNTKSASTTIMVGNGTSTASMQVSSTIDGRTDIRHGATTTISWNVPSAPSNSAVALWLVDVQSGQATALIERSLATSGTFVWQLPAKGSPCPADSLRVCGADLVGGRSYMIQASLYAPPGAYLGGLPPANPVVPTYLDEDYTAPFKVVD